MRRFITAPYNTDHNYHKNARLQCSRFSESRGVVHCEREKRVEGVKKKGRENKEYVYQITDVSTSPPQRGEETAGAEETKSTWAKRGARTEN